MSTISNNVPFPPLSTSLPELPTGWEKIDDPVYGVYYVE
jgi:hypothetical protein